MSIIGHKGIQVLSDINSVDDLPEIADVESEAVWYIESGFLAPDYIAPSFWDGEQFNEWISLVDGEVLAGIPDSVVSRYNADKESLGSQTTITDLIGDRHLQGSVEVADDGIGNQQVFEFRGDDFVENTDTYATEGDDIAVIFAYEIQESVNSNEYLFDADTDLHFALQDDNGGEFQFSRDFESEGQVDTGYAPDGDPHIGVIQAFADGTAELRIDGDAKGKITVGTEDLDGLLLAERGIRDDRGVDIDYNEVEVAVNFDSEDITDEEERLSDKLGIDLS